MKKRSRALSPPLFLSDRVQCVVAAGGWDDGVRGCGGDVFLPDCSLSAKNDEEGCFSAAKSILQSCHR